MAKELYQDLEIYIHKIRPQTNSDVNNVFVTYYRKILESVGISKQINSVWQKAGVSGEHPPPVKKNSTANIFRKSGSTATEEVQGDEVMYVDSLLSFSPNCKETLQINPAGEKCHNRHKSVRRGVQ